MSRIPIALTVAGTDPTGGAGGLADSKTFHSRGVYGMAAVTSLTKESAAVTVSTLPRGGAANRR